MKKLGILTALGSVGLGVSLFACNGGTGPAIGKTSQALEALVPLQGCGEVENYIRDRMRAEVNRQVDRALENLEKSSYACGGYYGGGYGGADAGSPSSGASGGSSSGSSGSSSSSSSSSGGGGAPSAPAPSDVSKTNNQVAGVDEADFIKNDDQFLYIVGNGALRIVKAWPANESALVSKVALEGTPKKLFVEGNQAIVYVSVPKATPAPSYGGGYGYGSGECTYGYDCVPSGDGTATKLVIFDITNRAAPQRVRDIDLSGSLLSARRIGTSIHTVVVDAPPQLRGLESYPKNLSCSGSDPASEKAKARAAWEELRQANLAVIASADVMGGLPTIKDGGQPTAQCQGYFRPSVAEGRSLTSIVSVDLGGGAPVSSTVVSDPGVVYASETSLYMSVPHTRDDLGGWYGPEVAEEKFASTIHQFRIGAAASLTGYEASGIVKGRVLNQFALDEHDGHLRVATTSGRTPAPEVHSTMSVLAREGNRLALKGKVDDIAKGEDIHSVRFDGSHGFVITFKKTDPLFVFDLGNPSAPSITGELKIPGFSTYMQMMDAQHLLTIGYDAADQGDFAWFTGVMLQIFDVSDMKNPRLAHKEVIGTRGSSSEALTNHLAFNYFAKKNLLAFPMTICEGGNANGGYGTNMTFAGLIVYDLTTDGGFKLRGKVAHPQNASGYDSSACSNWWTQAKSEVKRSVIMDDFVYSVSDRRVKVNGLGNLGADLADIALDK